MTEHRIVNDRNWPVIRNALDRNLAEVTLNYIKARRVSGAELFNGYRAVGSSLRGGDEPDYENPAVVAGYAFEYFVRRAASIIGALDCLPTALPPIRRVLDIGSGSGADQAICLLRDIEHPAFSAEIFKSHGDGYFDLVIMSACLPYRLQLSAVDWRGISAAVRRVSCDSCVMVAIQPDVPVKVALLQQSMDFLSADQMRIVKMSSGDYPGTLLRGHVLVAMSNLFGELTGSRFKMKSWNEKLPDQVRFLMPRR